MWYKKPKKSRRRRRKKKNKKKKKKITCFIYFHLSLIAWPSIRLLCTLSLSLHPPGTSIDTTMETLQFNESSTATLSFTLVRHSVISYLIKRTMNEGKKYLHQSDLCLCCIHSEHMSLPPPPPPPHPAPLLASPLLFTVLISCPLCMLPTAIDCLDTSFAS